MEKKNTKNSYLSGFLHFKTLVFSIFCCQFLYPRRKRFDVSISVLQKIVIIFGKDIFKIDFFS